MKIRIIKSKLFRNGFVLLPRRGKGSHAIFEHKTPLVKITISGKNSTDALPYQVKQYEQAISQVSHPTSIEPNHEQ